MLSTETKKKGLRPRLSRAWARLRGGKLTPKRAGLSVGIGIAIGCVPIYGAHWALVLAICLPLRLDAAASYLAANISNPFVAPFLLFAEVEIGSMVLTGHLLPVTAKGLSEHGVGGLLEETVVGTLLFAPSLALVLGAITYGLVAARSTTLVRRNGS